MAQQELFGGRPNNALPDDIEELNRLFKERAAANAEWSTFAFIPGEGPKGSRVAVVGESPGPPDIQSGRPFMGPAGDMLVRILSSINLHRRDCYLTNGIKLVTTGEQITSRMIRFFAPLLSHELTLVDPAVIICFGNTPTQMLLGSKTTISATRGQ